MQAKNIILNNYNLNIVAKIIKRFSSLKKSIFFSTAFIFLFLILSFTFLINFHRILNSTENRNSFIADFKLDVNNLSETAAIIESERKLDTSSELNCFGSDGQLIKLDEIKPDLKVALVNIADTNKDGNLSNEEILDLKIMKLKPDVFRKELRTLQVNLKGADCNLKNYVIITKGAYSGTILYNGPFKFVDNENNRYFGLELLS